MRRSAPPRPGSQCETFPRRCGSCPSIHQEKCRKPSQWPPMAASGGSPTAPAPWIFGLTPPGVAAEAAAEDLAALGYRVRAVAAGPEAAMRLAGFIALSDRPRTEAPALISRLRTMGVRVVMVTGDAPTTAGIVARAVGIKGAVPPPGGHFSAVSQNTGVFAGIMPEDKLHIVQALQRHDHIVGMCADSANDVAALRQAQIGIAASTATDVAKSAAGIVLTEPGLGGIVAAVHEGRITFQRIPTYCLRLRVRPTRCCS
jgi:H+-transporting ATPase